MSTRRSVKTRPSMTGVRRANAEAALAGARAAIRAQNRRFVALPARGINSASVFQPPAGKEKKFLDATQNVTFVAAQSTNTGLLLCNGIAQGTAPNQHVGREVNIKSFYWMFEGTMGSTTTGASPVRLLIVYDKDASGAPPTVATGAVTDICASDSIVTPMNLYNSDRFIVLVDEIIETIGTAGPQSFMRKGYRKVSLPMIFNATTTATITAIQTGSIYAVAWQNGGLATANFSALLQTRIRFEDA